MSRRSRKKSRNRLLAIAAAVVVAIVAVIAVVRLGGPPAAPESAAALEDIPKSARGFLEPPALAEKVAAGTLPAIDERLPPQPFVVGAGTLLPEENMTWQDGRYGGTIEAASTGNTGFINIAGGATILRSPSQSTAVSTPNIVSSLEHNPDFTVYTFTIREGLRWSDGEPLTTEDVRFAFEDLYGDKDVKRPWPTALYTQGNADLGPAKLTVVDPLKFELTFSKPYGYFSADLNSWIPYYTDLIKPAHYLKQFHAKYADADELKALVKKDRKANWVELLAYRDVLHWDVGEQRALGMPVLNAWMLTQSTENRRVYERNPYFWHVDGSGHQLPYIDKVVNNIVVDTDAQTNAVLAGQVTLASGGEVSLNKMSVYKQNAERSGLNIFTTGSFNSPLQLFLNRDYEYKKDASSWQTLMSDPQSRFGQAVAAAIDTKAINDSVYYGLYQPLAPEFQQHDPALANQLLDSAGMAKKDSKGMRLGPDGKAFTLQVTHNGGAADFDPVTELIKEQLEDVGVRVDLEKIDGILYDQRKAANQMMSSINWNDGNGWQSGISEDYLPASKGPWSPATWSYFTSNGQQGRKPSADLQEFYRLHTERKQYPPESAEGQALYSQMQTWLREHYAFIPTAGVKTTPNVVDRRLRNIPKEGSPIELDTYINAEGMWFDQ